MHRALLTLTFLFVSAMLSGQNPYEKSLSIGFNFSVDRCNLNSNYLVCDTRLANTGGIKAIYQYSSSLLLETGLEYSVKGYKTFLINWGFSNPAINERDTRVINSFYYLDIPVEPVFVFGNGDVHFTLGAGVCPGILLGQVSDSVYEYNQGAAAVKYGRIDEQLKPYIVSAIFNPGIDYHFFRGIHFRFEPVFKFSLTSMSERVLVKEYPYSLGLNFSAYFSLK